MQSLNSNLKLKFKICFENKFFKHNINIGKLSL